MKKVLIAAMIVAVAAALNGCTYSSGAKVATGTTNPTSPTTPTAPTTPTTPTTPTPPAPPAGTPTPVAPTNPAPITIPTAGSNEQMNPVQGTWTTLPVAMPINPVHGILLTTGNVLYIAGSGNCPPGQTGCPTDFGSATLWNPTTGTFTTFPL